MSISTILGQQLDGRKNGNDCEFNGYLEDYLNLNEGEDSKIEPILKEAFEAILAKDADVKICVGLASEINKDAVSNQIIRYKDIFKLAGKALVYPYILYVKKDGEERALLIVPHAKYSYICAKGYYYCMTEPGSLFIDCKNEIVAISSNSAAKIADTYSKLFTMKAGALQRTVDRECFTNYEELKAEAIASSKELKEEACTRLASTEDRTPLIYHYVLKWFLLKKVLYVQYMVNKNILTSAHEGNVKKQRNQAKLNADEIAFMSFSEMWRIPTQPTIDAE